MATVLLDHLQKTNVSSIELDNDYFWSIPFDSVYDVDSPPADLTIGQVTEIVESLSSMVAGKDLVNHGLVWLGDLFRAVGGQARL